MKASVKFREKQKPLFRAKVPFNFLGFPFQSGIVACESKDLSFNLTASFESWPSLKVAYRPNDFLNPISVVFKTTTLNFSSPISSSLNMSAEFKLIEGDIKPSLFVHFKPHLGDFIVKKVQSSVFKKQNAPVIVHLCNKLESPSDGVVNGVLADVEMTTTMAVPLRKTATLSFRWGVSRPATKDRRLDNSMAGISVQKLPSLKLNKIGFDCKVGPAPIGAADFLAVKKQLEIIQAENAGLKKAVDNLKGELFTRLEITQAENGTSKKAADDLYGEFAIHSLFWTLIS